MGLDQFAYAAAKAGQYNEHYETGTWDPEKAEYVGSTVSKPREIAYWRKHPNLQGWMQQLWLKKLNIPINASDQFIEDQIPGSFNGVELELTWADLEQLEVDIKRGAVAALGTKGFFFGDPSDDYYREHDLEFIRNAKAELFSGLRVFYNSSW